MKNKFLVTLATAFSGLFLTSQHGFSQGSLTPPGAPAPTMITLAQIEPRTPISSAPFTIAQPGSYYLTTNLTVASGNAITVNTNQVTLDLNGFTISSTASSPGGYAIGLEIPANNNDISIFNGHIMSGTTNNGTNFSGPGFGFGIVVNGSTPQNVSVTKVTVSGCAYDGISLGGGASTIVESCAVQNSGIYGINAQTVCHSTASQCGSTAIGAVTASDCSGTSVIAGGIGIQSSTANNCVGSAPATGQGIHTFTANNCYGSAGGTGYGITSIAAINCYGIVTGAGIGINTTTAVGCVGYAQPGGKGIQATVTNACSSTP